ncbi:hypothetical protein C8J56DRAFT_940124, partial [Mycena floridula]
MANPESTVPQAIIEQYVQGIRPLFSYILSFTVFSAMLVPLLIMLLSLSTSQSRRTPIFILNVIQIFLGLGTGITTIHLTIQNIFSPFSSLNVIQNYACHILLMWLPWLTEAILLLRLFIVFTPTHRHFSSMASLLAPSVICKTARFVINIVCYLQWAKHTSNLTGANFNTGVQSFDTWLAKVGWSLEILDNGYVSFMFLWRLSRQTHLFDGSTIGRVESGSSKASLTSRLKTLFWIASTNFIFPLVFLTCQLILALAGKDLVVETMNIINTYVSIISTVFATIWSSTTPQRSVEGPTAEMHHITFRSRGQQSATVVSVHTEVVQDGESCK